MALSIEPIAESNEIWGNGSCDHCGAKDVDLYCVCDDEKVCAECLDSYFFPCEECGRQWDLDVMEERDGQQLCPNCADEYDSDHEEEAEEEDEEEGSSCCDRCGKECEAFNLEDFDGEMLCEDCLEKAKIDGLDPDGIWFSDGGWNRCVYSIQGDGTCSSASFAEYDADEAFDLWTQHCVDLTEALDEAFYFFMRKGTLRKGPVYCLFKDDTPSDLAEQLEISEEEAEAMSDGKAPKGWVCVSADKAQKFLQFDFAGM